MDDIRWTCSKECGWNILAKVKPIGSCKCGGKIITKRKAKKKAWRAKREKLRIEQSRRSSLNREIAQATDPRKTVRQYLREL